MASFTLCQVWRAVVTATTRRPCGVSVLMEVETPTPKATISHCADARKHIKRWHAKMFSCILYIVINWTQRVTQQGPPSGGYELALWDALGVDNPSTYDSILSWPASCTGVNQGILTGLASEAGIQFVQGASNTSSATGVTSASISFAENNRIGSRLFLGVAFGAGTFIAGNVTVSDSNGNSWGQFSAGNPAFQPDFLQLWVTTALIKSAANTVTVTYDGSNPLNTISLIAVEYVDSGIATVSGEMYGTGPVFGTGSPVDLSVTITQPSPLLILLSSTNSIGCTGFAATGGGTEIPQIALPVTILSINDKTLPVYSLRFPMSDCEQKDPCRERYPLL